MACLTEMNLVLPHGFFFEFTIFGLEQNHGNRREEGGEQSRVVGIPQTGEHLIAGTIVTMVFMKICDVSKVFYMPSRCNHCDCWFRFIVLWELCGFLSGRVWIKTPEHNFISDRQCVRYFIRLGD